MSRLARLECGSIRHSVSVWSVVSMVLSLQYCGSCTGNFHSFLLSDLPSQPVRESPVMPLESKLHNRLTGWTVAITCQRPDAQVVPFTPQQAPGAARISEFQYPYFKTLTQLSCLNLALIKYRKGSRLQVPWWSSGKESSRLKGASAVSIKPLL